MTHFDFAKATLSVKINQIAALIKVSILNATHSASICSDTGVKGGIVVVEGEVARTSNTNRTAPIDARDGTDTERTTDAAAAVRLR